MRYAGPSSPSSGGAGHFSFQASAIVIYSPRYLRMLAELLIVERREIDVLPVKLVSNLLSQSSELFKSFISAF